MAKAYAVHDTHANGTISLEVWILSIAVCALFDATGGPLYVASLVYPWANGDVPSR